MLGSHLRENLLFFVSRILYNKWENRKRRQEDMTDTKYKRSWSQVWSWRIFKKMGTSIWHWIRTMSQGTMPSTWPCTIVLLDGMIWVRNGWAAFSVAKNSRQAWKGIWWQKWNEGYFAQFLCLYRDWPRPALHSWEYWPEKPLGLCRGGYFHRHAEKCPKSLCQEDQSWKLFHACAEDLPFADNSFDIVYHIGGINFFSDKAKGHAGMLQDG